MPTVAAVVGTTVLVVDVEVRAIAAMEGAIEATAAIVMDGDSLIEERAMLTRDGV